MAAIGLGADKKPQDPVSRKKTARKGLFALAAVGALAFSMLWNPPTGSVHSYSQASDYNAKKESGCVNSGKGCHGDETAYTDFNDYHPDVKCGTCHEYTGVGCIPCHTPAEHECALCHDGTMDIAGDRVRLTDPYPRGHYRETTHTAMGTDMDVPVRAADGGKAQATCEQCHKRDLRKAHTGVKPAADSRYGEDIGCGECHNDRKSFGQREVLGDWKNRACESCHSEKSATPMHEVVGPKAPAKSDVGCGESGAGCHEGTDLHALHPDAPLDCSGSAVEGEPGCHDLSVESHVPSSTACGGEDDDACHRAYVGDDFGHAHDSEVHSPETRGPASDTSYYGTACGACHLMEPDGTSLVDEHARPTSELSSDPNNCTNCHIDVASAEAIQQDWPDRDTSGACDACHGERELDSAHAADTEARHDVASSGCSDTGPGCHPTSDLFEVGAPTTTANIHRDCVRCHDATPSGGNSTYAPGSTTCGGGRACHAGGYSNTTSVHDGDAGRTDGSDALHTARARTAKAVLVDDASGLETTCDECHDAQLGVEHERTNNAIAAAAPNTCRACHSASSTTGGVVKSSAAWASRANACGDCHGASVASDHSDTAAAHEGTQLEADGSVAADACAKAGCHATADLRVLHKGGCTTSGCHASEGDIFGLGIIGCGGKNPERSCHVGVHDATSGNDPENHLAGSVQKNAKYNEPTSELSPTCGTCHQMFLGVEHERPNSAIAADVPVGSTLCARCHDRNAYTKWVSTNEWPTRNTTGACSACHGKLDVSVAHRDVNTVHTASELATNGTPAPGYCAKSGCHPTADVRRLHRFVGCNVEGCHQNTGDIRGLNIKSCGGNAATSCHNGYSQMTHPMEHSVLLTGTVNGVTYGPAENEGCAPGCHQSDLRLEHSAALLAGSMDGGGSSNCHVCHAEPDDPNRGAYSNLQAVKDAIANRDRRCVACHASGTATDGPTHVASAHKAISTDPTRPAGMVWADPNDQWKAAYDGPTGGGHNVYPYTTYGATQSKQFPVTTFTVGAATYKWALAPNSAGTIWLKRSVYATASYSPSATTEATSNIQHISVTCNDCHSIPAAMAGPQGAAVKVMIDPDYSQTEYANPGSEYRSATVTMTYQFDPYNIDPGHTVKNPPGYKPVICFKCHATFTNYGGPNVAPTSTAIGGNGLHRTHRWRAYGTHDGEEVYRSGYCIDCHVRIPHAWRRPRMLVRTVATTDTAPVDTAPYVGTEHAGLVAMRLVNFPNPASVSRGNCVTGGCYDGTATQVNHPTPSIVTTWSFWP